MFAVFKSTILLAIFCAGSVIASKSCRQCHGELTVTFDGFATRALADEVFKSNLNGCATANQYDILGVRYDDLCNNSASPIACTKWIYTVKVWRYCGNGSNVLKSKVEPHLSFTCDDGKRCSASSYLSMTCNPSVECRGSCSNLQC